MAIPAVIFDDGKGQLSPLTDLRAAFDIRTGALTNVQRFALEPDAPPLAGLLCPEHLAAVTRERHTVPVNPATSQLAPSEVFLVNGRWAACDPSQLGNLDEVGDAAVEELTGELLFAHVHVEDVGAILAGDLSDLAPQPWTGSGNRLLRRPWDVRSSRDAAIKLDLGIISASFNSAALPDGVIRLGGKVVGRIAHIHPTARIAPTVVLDCESGPVVIDEHATIRPGAIICGPAYIGPHSTVLDRCLIKPNTVIGPHCKVAGEIGGTIFQGFANKSHDGHLGDSYVGEWANLGAGTTNSNLLNTYGEVIARPFQGGSLSPKATPFALGPNERTGEQFLGAIIGDHCKFAICTRIMTGAIVGTGTMWAATAPVSGTIAPFSWVTDSGTRKYAMSKFADVMKTVMVRRKVTPGEAYVRRMESLNPQTQA